MRWNTCALVASLLCGLASSAQAGHPPIEMVQHTVTKGETCASIVGKQYRDSSRYDILHAYNPQLGEKLPHHLEAGMVLSLPAKIPPQAWVLATWRTVEHRVSGASSWLAAKTGTPLRVGYRVSTRTQSAAQLVFKDNSQLELGEDTLLIVYGRSASDAKAGPRNRATLRRGTLRSRLAELRGKTDPEAKAAADEAPAAPLEIVTDGAVASFAGSEALMSVDTAGLSCVSNFGGAPVEVGSVGSKRRVKVKVGMGTRVKRGKRPEKPRPLPKAPKWSQAGPVVAFGATAEQAVAQFRWTPAKKAVEYSVRISRPDGSLLAASTLPRTETRLRLRGLPAGKYSLTVSVKSALGLVSLPSTARAFEIFGLKGASAPKIPKGTTVQGCATATALAAPEVTLQTAGLVTLRCGDDEIAVEVTP